MRAASGSNEKSVIVELLAKHVIFGRAIMKNRRGASVSTLAR